MKIKFKYMLRFYKYFFQANFWYFIGVSSLLIVRALINLKFNNIAFAIDIASYIALAIGSIFYFIRAISVLKYVPNHFNDYLRIVNIIEEGRKSDKNFQLRDSTFYMLCLTRCGTEILKSLIEEGLIQKN